MLSVHPCSSLANQTTRCAECHSSSLGSPEKRSRVHTMFVRSCSYMSMASSAPMTYVLVSLWKRKSWGAFLTFFLSTTCSRILMTSPGSSSSQVMQCYLGRGRARVSLRGPLPIARGARVQDGEARAVPRIRSTPRAGRHHLPRAAHAVGRLVMPNSHAEPLTQRFDQLTRPKALHYRLKFQGGVRPRRAREQGPAHVRPAPPARSRRRTRSPRARRAAR